MKPPKAEKQARASDNRPLGLSRYEDSDDDFNLYLGLRSVSVSENARKLSRLVRRKEKQMVAECFIYHCRYPMPTQMGFTPANVARDGAVLIADTVPPSATELSSRSISSQTDSGVLIHSQEIKAFIASGW